MLFDVGNLITLGIMILLLIFFRLLDKGNRSIEKARKYAERCKDDIAAFIEEKGSIIRNYGIDLEVERKAASELMRRIQNLTREDLAHKVNALTQIDERIRLYDASLEELVQMTGRVQENLNRIRDESAFVESVGKRVGDVKDKVERSMNEITVVSEKLEAIEQHFARENAIALEKAVDLAVSSAHSRLLDFEASTQTIERKVEENRELLEKVERRRLEKLTKDEDKIERILAEAIDKAGSRAEKLEEATLVKLRDQAHERLNHIKANFEDKIKSVQETVKIKLAEIQEQIKANREEWKAEIASIEAQQKKLGEVINRQQEEWIISSNDTKQEIILAAQDQLDDYRLAQQEQFKQLAGLADDTANMDTELRRFIQETLNRANVDFTRYGDEIRASWEGVSGEYTGHLGKIRKELEIIDRDITKIKEKAYDNVSKKLKGFEDEFLSNISGRSAKVDNQLAEWHDFLDKKLEKMVEESETKRKRAETRINDEIRKAIAAQVEKTTTEMERLKANAVTLDESIEEARRNSRELIQENEKGVATIHSSMDDIRKEIAEQTKLFDRNSKIKAELDRHLQDMNNTIYQISQLKNEITRVESQITNIKRLEDEVNTKLNRFHSEKRRIEVIETDFNRLLQTSQAVEAKLTQVSNSDDALQSMLIQFRRLDDIIKETDDKYQRLERKNTTLQEINDSIERNFRTMQDNEQLVKTLDDTVDSLKRDLDSVQNSVQSLMADNEKAQEAAEKLTTLDDSIKWLEKRIAEMNVARENLARLATELQNLDKDAQTHLKLTRSLLDRESGKAAGRAEKGTEKGATPPRDRENIISLKRKGWSIDEIARTMNISRGEVELILELGPKDV